MIQANLTYNIFSFFIIFKIKDIGIILNITKKLEHSGFYFHKRAPEYYYFGKFFC